MSNDALREALDEAAMQLLAAVNKPSAPPPGFEDGFVPAEDVKLADRLDVFKAVAGYYANLLAKKAPKSGDDSDAPQTAGFGAMRQRINEAEAAGAGK